MNLEKNTQDNRRYFLKKAATLCGVGMLFPSLAYTNDDNIHKEIQESIFGDTSSINEDIQNDIFGKVTDEGYENIPQKFTSSNDIDTNEYRSLQLYNTHTTERLNIIYYQDGKYLRHSMNAINKIMADHRTGKTVNMDKKLIDTLYMLKKSTNNSENSYINIISAYRSPVSNRKLRRRSRRVAKNSFHTKGQAIDINIDNVSLSKVRKKAKLLHKGGVGYYPRSKFVHIDVGDVRSWRG
ncbi:MAG: hypothetical protein DRG11_03350 [Epsilonproteobacteria bacterium]|nr:MAG: hypothetical protein DRG11_03350 [Campylobacterota bacterium]